MFNHLLGCGKVAIAAVCLALATACGGPCDDLQPVCDRCLTDATGNAAKLQCSQIVTAGVAESCDAVLANNTFAKYCPESSTAPDDE